MNQQLDVQERVVASCREEQRLQLGAQPEKSQCLDHHQMNCTFGCPHKRQESRLCYPMTTLILLLFRQSVKKIATYLQLFICLR